MFSGGNVNIVIKKNVFLVCTCCKKFRRFFPSYSRIEATCPAVCPESQKPSLPSKEREISRPGHSVTSIRWTGSLEARNQRPLPFQHDILCTSVLEARDPAKLTLDQQKLLAIRRIPGRSLVLRTAMSVSYRHVTVASRSALSSERNRR